MAYAHIRDKRKFQRKWVSEKYETNEQYREAEKARKARWYQANRDRLIQKVLDARAQARQET